MQFPHKFPPHHIIHSITLPWTMALRTNVKGSPNGIIDEFDCELSIAIGDDDGSCIWHVESVNFEPYPKGDLTVTAESDPVMWEIIRRDVMANYTRLDEIVFERRQEIAA